MTAMRSVEGKAEVRAEAAFKTEDDLIESITSPTGQGCYLHFTDGDTKNHQVEQLAEGHPTENEILNQLKIKSSNNVRRNRAASGFHTLPGTVYPKGPFSLMFSFRYTGGAHSEYSIQRTN